ncbi:MAG TPA: DUF3943 domain-containing protein [Polyangia bacterium]|nr:DUF3943 domain-containing protein [Polyangia bacterium]
MVGRAYRNLVAALLVTAAVLRAPSLARAADLSAGDTQPVVPTPSWPYLRTALEEAAAFAVQAAWYWGHMKHWSPDDVRFTWKTWREKLFSDDYLVFDDDRFRTGGLGHPLAGAFYYQIARGNGFSAGGSFAASVIMSTIWQYLGEWNTKPSINDLVITPAAGWVIGEATFRLGRVFAAGEPSAVNCIGAVLFSPTASLNDARVCHGRPNQPPFDRWGFPGRTWYDLQLQLGAAHTVFDQNQARDELVAGLAARVTTSSAYRQPGAGTVTATPGQWTSISGRGFLDSGSLRGEFLHADSLLAGRYARQYGERDAAGRGPDGRGVLFGLGSMFDYDVRDLPVGWDRMATAGVLGPVAELEARHGLVAVHVWLEAAYAFGQITSLAYEQTRTTFANVYIRSELKHHDYYYGQGVVSDGAIELELGDFRLAFGGRGGSYWSFNSRDTNQSRIQDNFSLHDTRVYLQSVASIQPRRSPLRLSIELDEDLRESVIPRTVFHSVERRLMGSAMLVF